MDGAPPGGWEAAAPYLVLPVLLVLAQYVSSAVISPVDPNAETATSQKLLIGVLPLAIGYFALTVPSALTLYYFSNTTFTTAQQARDCRSLSPLQCSLAACCANPRVPDCPS